MQHAGDGGNATRWRIVMSMCGGVGVGQVPVIKDHLHNVLSHVKSFVHITGTKMLRGHKSEVR